MSLVGRKRVKFIISKERVKFNTKVFTSTERVN